MSIKNGDKFFCSWSGGKDSCLALYYAVQMGGVPVALLTMLTEHGKRSRSHGLRKPVLNHQARSLGIQLFTRNASWNKYEEKFIAALCELKKQKIDYGVFGDIDLLQHLDWVQKVCSRADIKPVEPLWQKDRTKLLNEFISIGFEAIVVAVNQKVLNTSYLGKRLNPDLIAELTKIGIDPSGEQGEYHTLVTNGPIFSFPLKIQINSTLTHKGYAFLDIQV